MRKNYKEATKRLYDRYAKKYEKNTRNYTKYIENELQLFLKNLKGKRILDLGSGPGRDSLYFKNRGFGSLCIDFSEKMIGLCKEKGLEAKVMDIEKLDFPENSFDGVWAYTSLIHVSKKNIKRVIKKISGILKSHGILSITMKEGKNEEFIEDLRYPNEKRYTVFYSEKELLRLFSGYFECIYTSKSELSKTAYIYMIFEPKNSVKNGHRIK